MATDAEEAEEGAEAAERRGLATLARERGLPAQVNPATVKGFVALGGGLAILFFPEVSEELVDVIVGIGLLVTGLSDLWFRVRGARETRYRGTGETFLAIAAGVALLAWPSATLRVFAAVVAVYLLVRGVVVIATALRNREGEPWGLELSRGVLYLALGSIALLLPGALRQGLFAMIAVAAVILGVLLITFGLRPRSTGDLVDLDAGVVSQILVAWVRVRDVGDPRREEIGASIFFEEPGRRAKLASWWVMLMLSVAIGTLGIMQDSTAVVIGAMLVAPLMTPILGAAAGIANAWPRRVIDSIGLTTLGVIAAIGLTVILGQWLPAIVPLESNSQVTSRINPNLLDMLIALAAGAAGAYATVNRRVSAGIAGVAIAVALVPPLGVVGLNLEAGSYDDAFGAFLLFLTNFVSIILAATVVFMLTGYVNIDRFRAHRDRVRASLSTVVIAALVILVPLVFTAEGVVSTASRQQAAQGAVEDWVGTARDIEVRAVEVDGETVEIDLAGSGDVPDLRDLERRLTQFFGTPVAITVNHTPTKVLVYPQGSGGQGQESE